MTKVARLFEEEKIEAVNQTRREERIGMAKTLLMDGIDRTKVMEYTGLTLEEVIKIQESLGILKAS